MVRFAHDVSRGASRLIRILHIPIACCGVRRAIQMRFFSFRVEDSPKLASENLQYRRIPRSLGKDGVDPLGEID